MFEVTKQTPFSLIFLTFLAHNRYKSYTQQNSFDEAHEQQTTPERSNTLTGNGTRSNLDKRIRAVLTQSDSIQSTSSAPSSIPAAPRGSGGCGGSSSSPSCSGGKVPAMNRLSSVNATASTGGNGGETQRSPSSKADPFYGKLTLGDFEHLCQLGMGGFGMVNLVRCKPRVGGGSGGEGSGKIFALKRCSKDFIRSSHQQQHIVNEKLVMQRIAGRHQFIVQLFRTFRDEKCVYFLMEAALGGELWTVLRQK